MMVSTDPARAVGARLRAAKDVVRCILGGKPLPLPFAFAEKGDYGDSDRDDTMPAQGAASPTTAAAAAAAAAVSGTGQRQEPGAGSGPRPGTDQDDLPLWAQEILSEHSGRPASLNSPASPVFSAASPSQADVAETARFDMTEHVAAGGHRVRSGPSLQSDVLGTIQRGQRNHTAVRASLLLKRAALMTTFVASVHNLTDMPALSPFNRPVGALQDCRSRRR